MCIAECDIAVHCICNVCNGNYSRTYHLMGYIGTACAPVLIRLGYRFMVMNMSSLVERFSRGCRR